MSRIRAMATWPITRALLRRWREDSGPAFRADCFKVGASVARVAWSAGTSPKATALSSATAAATASAPPSTLVPAARGSASGAQGQERT